MKAQHLQGFYLTQRNPKPFIVFIDRNLNTCEYTRQLPGLMLSFDRDILPEKSWPPLITVIDYDCHPILLNELQAMEFQQLFYKIEAELHSTYIFKEEYIGDLLKLIVLLMAKIITKHN